MATGIRWRLLWLADSAFPTGGFAHSAGLEAAVHLGEARTPERLDAFVRGALWNVGHASLPFVAAAHDEPDAIADLDARIDAALMNHVANRASRTQGRAFVATCARVFDEPSIALLAARARDRIVPSHLAPTFGAALHALGIERRDALAIHLHLALRGLASAAIRIGVAGPHEAHRLAQSHAATLDLVLEACERIPAPFAASVAPIADIMGATHDRLYSRLFQS